MKLRITFIILIFDISMSDDENSWDDGIVNKTYQSEFMDPKAVFHIIDYLKSQDIYTIKAKFQLVSEKQKKQFVDALVEEEQLDTKVTKKKQDEDTKKKPDFDRKKGWFFQINNFQVCQVYMRMYKSNLDRLSKDHSAKIRQIGENIFIEKEKKQHTILESQLMQMKKKLKMFYIHRDNKLFEALSYSMHFKKELENEKIFVYKGKSRFLKTTAFYSNQLENEQQIRKTVLKHKEFLPKIINFYDKMILFHANTINFELLSSFLKRKIQELRDIYDANLQVNESAQCLILHTKHQVFQKEIMQELSKQMSNLVLLSFNLFSSRTFYNFLKRNEKKYNFIRSKHDRNIAYCCIDKSKIKQKKDLISVFSHFLNSFNKKTKMTIYLSHSKLFQKTNNLYRDILDVASKFNLNASQDINESQGYHKIIQIKPEELSQVPIKNKQINFVSFLYYLLIDSKKSQKASQSDLDFILKMSQKQSLRKQQKQQRQLVQKQQKKEAKKKFREKQQILAQKQKQQNSNNQLSTESHQKSFQEILNSSSFSLIQNVQTDKKQQIQQQMPIQILNNSKILTEEQDAQKKYLTIKLQFTLPTINQIDATFEKNKRNKLIQKMIDQKYHIVVKVWNLILNSKLYNIGQDAVETVNKMNCYNIEEIVNKNNEPLKSVRFKNICEMKKKDISFLVYASLDGKTYIPSFMIEVF